MTSSCTLPDSPDADYINYPEDSPDFKSIAGEPPLQFDQQLSYYMSASPDTLDGVTPQLEAAIKISATKLVALEIRDPYVNIQEPERDPYIFKNGMFPKEMPNLRHVTLENIYFVRSFDFACWKMLTKLRIQQSLYGRENGHELSIQWLMALSNMPELEELALGWDCSCISTTHLNPFPTFQTKNPTAARDVNLNRLCRFILKSATYDIRDPGLKIFSHLRVPFTCGIAIQYGLHGSDIDLDEQLWPTVRRYLVQRTGIPGLYTQIRDFGYPKLDWDGPSKFGFQINVVSPRWPSGFKAMEVTFTTALYHLYPDRFPGVEQETVTRRTMVELLEAGCPLKT